MDQSLENSLGRQNRKLYMLLGFIVLLCFPVLVLLIGSTIEIEVTPKDANSGVEFTLVSGVEFPYFDKRLLISPSVIYELNSSGYESKRITVEQNDKLPLLVVEMLPLPGKVEIDVAPSRGMSWRVSGHKGEYTDLNRLIELPHGLAVFTVEGPEIETLQKEFFVDGKGKRQRLLLEPRKIEAMLEFSVRPRESSVFLNGVGQELSEGRFRAQLDVGMNQVDLRAAGYEGQTKTLNVRQSDHIDLGLIELIPRDITISLGSVPASAAVFLNSRFQGETPIELSVRPLNDYRITLRKVGFNTIEASLSPEIGRDLSEVYHFSRKSSVLRIDSSVPAVIFVNGQKIAESPSEVSVSEGDSIEVTADGYAVEKMTVNAGHLQSQKFFFEMVKSDREAFVDAPPRYEIEAVELVRVAGRESLDPIVRGEARSIFKVPDLYVSETEITNRAYARYLNQALDTVHDTLPKTGIGWEDAARYCNWLSIKEGLEPFYSFTVFDGVEIIETKRSASGFRLPTLTEWRYFFPEDKKSSSRARVNRELDLPERGIGNLAGRETSSDVAWYFDGYIDEYVGLSPVKSFRPNELGLYDLVGNVREWLHNNRLQEDDYFGSDGGLEHIVAGSSYKSGKVSELSIMHVTSEIFGGDDIGFRVVREIK